MKEKRQRSDSITGAAEILQNLIEGPLKPPKHMKLRRCDRPFWESIMDARARETWTPADLELAVILAQAKADIMTLRNELTKEPMLIDGKRNQKCMLIDTLIRQALRLSQQLHIHAAATQGRARDTGARRQAAKELEPVAAQLGESDPLIPTAPSQH